MSHHLHSTPWPVLERRTPGGTRLGRRPGGIARRAAILALMLAIAPVVGAEKPAPVADRVLTNATISVFISDPSFGKDPFYPQSKRRLAQLPALPVFTNTTVVDVTSDAVFELFNLKGISLAADQNLALINQYTFAEKEEQDCKVANQVIKVRCESIHERFVVISINGRKKELVLREGI
jgi:hypothetical protein